MNNTSRAIRVIHIDNGSADDAEVKAHPRLRLELRKDTGAHNVKPNYRWYNATYNEWIECPGLPDTIEAMKFADASWGHGWNLTYGA